MANKHPLADDENTAPTREAFLRLEDEYLALQGDDSDWAASERSRLKTQLKKFGPHAACGDEPLVEMVVPLSSTREPFQINATVYAGKCVVPACVARELASMVYRNLQVEANYLKGATKIYTGLTLSAKTLPGSE